MTRKGPSHCAWSLTLWGPGPRGIRMQFKLRSSNQRSSTSVYQVPLLPLPCVFYKLMIYFFSLLWVIPVIITSFKDNYLNLFFCVWLFCQHVHHIRVWVPESSEKSIRFSARATNDLNCWTPSHDDNIIERSNCVKEEFW